MLGTNALGLACICLSALHFNSSTCIARPPKRGLLSLIPHLPRGQALHP